MATFPQQVDTDDLGQALENFYNQINSEMEKKLREYQRSTNAGAQGENLSETDYNRRQLQEVFQKLRQGQEKVEVEWYEAQVERTSPPKVSMTKRSFQLEHRYGKWTRHSHDLA
jgi:hypothetical protein